MPDCEVAVSVPSALRVRWLVCFGCWDMDNQFSARLVNRHPLTGEVRYAQTAAHTVQGISVTGLVTARMGVTMVVDATAIAFSVLALAGCLRWQRRRQDAVTARPTRTAEKDTPTGNDGFERDLGLTDRFLQTRVPSARRLAQKSRLAMILLRCSSGT
jgi:hypothetical protein